MNLRSPVGALLCLIVLCGVAPLATAQPAAIGAESTTDTPALISLNETVYTTYSSTNAATSVSYSFRVGGGPERSAGFTGSGLRSALASNPEALAELARFRSKRVQSVIGGAVLAAGVAGTFAVGINKSTGERVFDPRTGRNEERSEINPVGFIPLGIGVAGLIYSGANYTGSGRHIQRAVAIYNGAVSGQGGAAASAGLTFGPSGTGVRLALSW